MNQGDSFCIADVFDAVSMIDKRPNYYRVVSISSAYIMRIPHADKISQSKEILRLQFDDATAELCKKIDIKFKLATKNDCQNALEFLQKGGPILIHCDAGVSRSTAVGLGYLLSNRSCYMSAVDELLQVRPCASPNRHVLKIMCQILNMENDFDSILKYISKIKNKSLPTTNQVKSQKKLKLYFSK
ncbi:dual specificity protein phosphatase family protein [Candidatus Uabimicrobium sp. HlEnr_7]|uniref:dual specificity protein phosphatase family protein n=1 Tax=Candidatus Uabimicrobium helgolandensis TaxID=3095367 RepID=UPI003555C948